MKTFTWEGTHVEINFTKMYILFIFKKFNKGVSSFLCICSVLGAILIVFGLYAVLWGKGKEVRKVTQLCPVKESSVMTIDGDLESSSVEVVGDSNSKHSSVRSNGESSNIEVVVATLYGV